MSSALCQCIVPGDHIEELFIDSMLAESVEVA